MRFAITASDRYLGVFEAFVNAGWEPIKLFTVPDADDIENHVAVSAFAEKHHAGIQISRMTESNLRDLRERQCETLIVASYRWRVADWRAEGPDCTNSNVQTFERKAELPEGVQSVLGFEMADRGEPFQKTDTILSGPRLPVRRFISARLQGCDLGLQYEIGGRGYSKSTALLRWDGTNWIIIRSR
jgi:hypothetical protein